MTIDELSWWRSFFTRTRLFLHNNTDFPVILPLGRHVVIYPDGPHTLILKYDHVKNTLNETILYNELRCGCCNIYTLDNNDH